MKRLKRDPRKFEIMKLFNTIGRDEGLIPGDEQSEKRFLEIVSSSLVKNKNNAILQHGLRTEDMFEYVAASLGECLLVKPEDAGVPVADTSDLQPPDYMVVLKDKSRLLVEVKNCNRTDPSRMLNLKEDYLGGLLHYADLLGFELKIAIYWSKWNLWTLVSPGRFTPSEGKRSISMLEAVSENEMLILGDFSVGTTPPLVFRIIPDRKTVSITVKDGTAQFRIGAIELLCGNKILTDKTEREYALYLMLYGDWESAPPVANMPKGRLSSIDYVAEPAQRTPGQSFELLGSMSSMISRRYRELITSSSGNTRTGIRLEPGSLGLNIPKAYKGKGLPLWCFYVKPTAPE